MKYNTNPRKTIRFCMLLAVLLLYQIVALCTVETHLNTTIERKFSPSVCLLTPPDTTIYLHICDGIPYHFHGHTYESDSTETITLHGQASDGGDSIIHLIVTEHLSPTVNISANPANPICEGESITLIANCDCDIRIVDQSFSILRILYCNSCGDWCPSSDFSPPPDGVSSCNGHAPDEVELSNYNYEPLYFPNLNNAYAADINVKLGKELSTPPETWIGSMTSRALDLSNPFKIIIKARGWGYEPGKIVVCVDNVPIQSFNTVANGWGYGSDLYAEDTLYFPAATDTSTITIKTDTIIKANGEITGYRAFIQRIQIIRLCHHYSWSTGINDSIAAITVQPEDNTSYSVTVTNDYGCSASDTYNVIVNHPHGTSETQTACGSYTWHDETYTVSNTYYHTHSNPDANGCYPVDTLHLTINEIPDVHISGNLNIAEGHSTTLTATPTGDQPYIYTWQSGTWSSGNSTTNEFTTSLLNEDTRYTVIVRDTNGCEGSDTVTVSVFPCESWQLVTDASELAVGDKIVITNSDATYILSTTQQPNNFRAKPISHIGNTLVFNDDAQIITIEQGTVNNTYALHVDDGYLYAASSTNNQLKKQTTNNANGSWRIEIVPSGIATIKAQGTNSRNWLRFHVPGGGTDSIYLFSCYSSGQNDISIYKRTSLRSETDTTVISCSGYYWRGNSYTESGDYSDTLTNSVGCDSIITLHLTVLHENAATVTFNPGNGTCDTSSLTEEDCQSGIILPIAASCAEGYTFTGWTTLSVDSSTSIQPSPLFGAGDFFNPTSDTTLYAVYQKCVYSDTVYRKVTEPLSDWSGNYLIAYTDGNMIFDGSLATLDAVNNYQTVSITSNTIPATGNLAKSFTIAQTGSNYTIRSASGKYIGRTTNSNGLHEGNTQYTNSISYSSGNINIIGSGGAYLRFNDASNQMRFRYFKSSTYTAQKAIQLYKYESSTTCEYTTFPPNPTSETSAIACRSYTWHGHTYTESGDYNDTLTNALGCDSVVTLHLTIHNPTITFDDTDPLTVCAGEDVVLHAYAHGNYEINYTWNFPDGHSLGWFDSLVIYNTNASDAGTYEVNASSTFFLSYSPLVLCMTSVIKSFTVTVNTPVHEQLSEVACESYTWNWPGEGDTTITESGDYTHNHEDANGCMQVDTLHLTINRSIVVDTTVVVCDSFNWNGNTYMWSGNYSDTLTNGLDCDSVVTLHLTINESPNLTITATADTICAGESDTLWVMRSIVPLVAVGDILCTDNSIVKPEDWPVAGKTAQGVVFYVDNTGQHGWVVNLQDQDFHRWAGSSTIGANTDISTMNNYATARDAMNDLDGYANTQRIREAGDASLYPAAFAVDFDHGWYLPAVGQLRILYAELYNIYESIQTVNGDPFVITNDTGWYWSSTEYDSEKTWLVLYTFGSVATETKTNLRRVRSVKNF